MNRRTLLKSTLDITALSLAVSAGLLTPGSLLAAYPKEAFGVKDIPSALTRVLGSSSFEHSDKIKIKAPDIAENGSVVPVTISSSLPGVESISIVVESNATPLVASFSLHGSDAYVSTRIKMGKTGKVLAVVKSGGKLFANKKEVKVTIGGCGG